MSLKSWLASLNTAVTAVTPVQAPIHAGLPCNGIKEADVTAVTDFDGSAPAVTSVTAAQDQTLQPQPAWALACTGVTAVTAENINADIETAQALTSLAQTEPKRLLRPCGAWLTDSQRSAATQYHRHHFGCPTCIAAGQGYGQRCAEGAPLWTHFQGGLDTLDAKQSADLLTQLQRCDGFTDLFT